MKLKFLLLLFPLLFLAACSWRIRFFILNSGNAPVKVEIKLKKDGRGFPIFHYKDLYVHEAPDDKIKDAEQEIISDTLEDYSHFKFTLAPHTAVEIGELQNDKYEKYDQYFINGRVFNLESLVISSGEKIIKVIPTTFDAYFKKGKYGEIYYYVK